ncbi:MAG TPA: rod shape-determining protein MreD [Terriglobales bacterium]|jgi:rod shape-determining protein MreD|nr:rod shape-determining protein MreD [Terriglobales bacterium]
MNAAVIYTSREEIEVYRFNFAATLFIPAAAVLLQSYLPVAFHGRLHFFDVFDLPLLVTIFFGVARRNPIAGSITGCLIGLAQDALTHNYLGLFGIAKTFVGYGASSLATRIDVENPGSRFLITVGFYMIHRIVYVLVQRGMVLQDVPANWLHSIGAALANGLLAIVVFAVLDRFKQRA